MNFYEDAKEALKKELLLGAYEIDERLIEDISKEFAKLHSTWKDGIFELRSKQLLFAYLLSYDVIHSTQKPIALSLGCGEGKQEGFAIALKLSYTALKKQNKKAKLLFLTATNELVMQMKNALPLQELDEVFVLEDEPKAQVAKKDGIYLLEFKTYMEIMLEQKQGAKYALLDNVSKIFIDEFHAFLSSSNHIKAQIDRDLLLDSNYQKSALNKFKLYKKILFEITSLQERYPHIVSCSPKRGIAYFNADGIKIDGLLAQKYLYSVLQEDLKGVGADNFEDFFHLVDTAAQALSQELGKDYYLFSEEGNIIDYAIADKDTAKPLLNTVYEDKLLGIFVLLKHIEDLDAKKRQRELNFLLRSFCEVTFAHITPIESIELYAPNRFAVASATLKGLQNQKEHLGFTTHYLQNEVLLDIEDKAVHITLSKEFDPKSISIEPESFDQIVITSASAKKLQSIAKALEHREKEFEIVSIFRDYINPNEKRYQKQISVIKEQIVKNPLQKRVILAQGLGEGSNILKHSPISPYRAKVIALEIEAIDKVTQKRYRIGTRGRARGVFEHSVTLQSKNLTLEEIKTLQTCQDIPQQIFEIEKTILKEEDRVKTSYVYKHANRRDFLKKAGVAGLLLTTAPNRLAELINDAFNKQILYKSEAKAGNYNYKNKKLPPGVAKCRNEYLKDLYRMTLNPEGWLYGSGYQDKRNEEILVRDIKENVNVDIETKLKEPLFWYICADINIYPDNNNIVYDRIKKENPALWEFSNGIYNYFKYWVRNKSIHFSIEKEFLNSIFIAGGKTKEEVEEYLKYDINTKEGYERKKKKLKEIMEVFKTYKPDPKLNKINDDYDKLLIAAWSSTWLVNHYNNDYNKYKKKFNFIYKNLEIPIRKIKNNFKIRGPPWYYDKGYF